MSPANAVFRIRYREVGLSGRHFPIGTLRRRHAWGLGCLGCWKLEKSQVGIGGVVESSTCIAE